MNALVEIESYNPGWLEVLKSQVESMRFGTVQVVVHESRVVQIEKTEKVRLDHVERSPSHVAAPHRRRP